MGLTNQEASGQEKKPLPPKEEECGCRDERRETEIVAFVKQPVIVCETFLVGKDIFNSDISNIAYKASEWLSTRALLFGSAADCIPHFGGVSSGALQRAVNNFIEGDHLVSPTLGSAPLVRAFGDWTPGRCGRPAACSRPGSQPF